MRILSVAAGPESHARRLDLGPVSPGVAAYRADAADDSAAMAGLLAELLLGARDRRWSAAPWAPGEARVAAEHGEVALRRSGSASAPRLTLAPLGTRSDDAPSPSPAHWQAGLTPAVLSAVFFSPPAPIGPLPSPRISTRSIMLRSCRTLPGQFMI